MRLSLFAVAALCVSSLAAHADNIQNFTLNATLDHGTATGTVVFDETTGLFTGGDIVATYGAKSFNFSVFDSSSTFDTVTYEQEDTTNGNYSFQLTIPGVKNKNYMGGPVCSDAHETGCQVTGGPAGDYYYTGFIYNGNHDFASNGTLTPTPEPSSFALLGTGLLGAIGVVRKRFA